MWTFDNIPHLGGKVFVVTGGNAGLGRVTARELARKHAHVIIACRSEERARPVVDAIRAETGNASVEAMTLDLLSLKSVDAFASAFLARGLPLHGLILNAGIMATPFTLSADDEDQGASTSLFLATDPTVEEKDYRGLYFDPIAKLVEPDSKIATDAALAKKLWEFTEKLVQEKVGK
ncbi:hypothetical protein HK405_013895 [Cladochytrium tenue]|nr:hypothetical protein HK405_013895 [Cladochytrium tenue]